MNITKLIVKGMHCHACEEIIKDSLEEQKGVESVKADEKSNTVIVSFDEKKIDLKKIKEIIVKEGYSVQ